MRESAENYLETILILKSQNSDVRAIDISKETGFSKPSVSIAIKKLKDEGLILTDSDGHISFTADGQKKAEQVYERHSLLTKAFIKIGVPPDIAEEDACKIEHQIHEITFQQIKKHLLRESV